MRAFRFALVLLPIGCSSLPPESATALRRVDLASTDLAALWAAVELPDSLRPLPGTARLVVGVATPAGRRERSFALQADAAASAQAAGEIAPPAGRHVVAFRLPPVELAQAEAFRAEAVALGGRAVSFGVAADACRVGAAHGGPLPFTSFVRTGETGRAVALTQPLDLRRLAGAGVMASLPECATV